MAHTFSDSIPIDADPDAVYRLICDVTRTGEWSPICVGCVWDDGDGPWVGARFTGHNRTPDRTWTTRARVVTAEPDREFGWTIGEGWAIWAYSIAAVAGGVELTESWQFTDAGLVRFADTYGDDADNQIRIRIEAARAGIPATLAAIKAIAEAG